MQTRGVYRKIYSSVLTELSEMSAPRLVRRGGHALHTQNSGRNANARRMERRPENDVQRRPTSALASAPPGSAGHATGTGNGTLCWRRAWPTAGECHASGHKRQAGTSVQRHRSGVDVRAVPRVYGACAPCTPPTGEAMCSPSSRYTTGTRAALPRRSSAVQLPLVRATQARP